LVIFIGNFGIFLRPEKATIGEEYYRRGLVAKKTKVSDNSAMFIRSYHPKHNSKNNDLFCSI
jgi:hypothetical protein